AGRARRQPRRPAPRAAGRRLGHRVLRRPHLPLLEGRQGRPHVQLRRARRRRRPQGQHRHRLRQGQRGPQRRREGLEGRQEEHVQGEPQGHHDPAPGQGPERGQHGGARPGPPGHRRHGRQERPPVPGADRDHRHPDQGVRVDQPEEPRQGDDGRPPPAPEQGDVRRHPRRRAAQARRRGRGRL
ncbi:MAG: SSU ribosomal protein S5p (S2e), partial [uncultured Phycisphaerae bacterium]